MSAVLNFQTPTDVRVTNLNLYRKLPGEISFTRIIQLPVVSSYTDSTTSFGAIYYFTFFDNVRFVESQPSPLIIFTNSLDAVSVSGFLTGIDSLPFDNIPLYGTGVTGGLLTVDVELKNDQTKAPIFDGQIISSVKQSVTVAADGTFVLSLIPNDLVFPGGTYYSVYIAGKRFFKTVSSTDGTSQLFTSLLDVLPFELR